MDERFEVDLARSKSRAYIFININSSLTSEVRYLRKDQPTGEFRVMLPRVFETEYDATHHGDSFFIRTNDGAKGFRVVEAPVADPSKANWKGVIPGREGVTIESVTAFQDYLVTLGIEGSRVSTISYGKELPLCQEHDESCWQQNRRDHFSVSKIQ